jgi:acetyl esterase
MTASESTLPLHPAYHQICEQSKKVNEEIFKKMEGATEEQKYQTIVQIRANSNLIASKLVLPETIRTEQEVFGGPNNVKVATTIFRPVGSENEVLPAVIFW